jgi:hypothetical protein
MGTYTHLFYNNNGFGHIFIKDNMYCAVCLIYGKEKAYGKRTKIGDEELKDLETACKFTLNKYGINSSPTEFIDLIGLGNK